MGGLADVQLRQLDLGDLALPGVEVNVHQPVLACMASQYAGWAVNVPATDTSKKYFAMGSGPARALYRGEPIFADIDYRDPAHRGRADPGVEPPAGAGGGRLDRRQVRRRARAPSSCSSRPTASLVGSVQIAARIVETGLHKMHEVGFDIATVHSGFGSCPLAPVAADDLTAIGRTNDAVLYGGRAWYTVETDDAAHRERDRAPALGRLARLRRAVRRALPPPRRRLLQDRPAAVQPGRGHHHERRERPDLPRRAASTPTSSGHRCSREGRDPRTERGLAHREPPRRARAAGARGRVLPRDAAHRAGDREAAPHRRDGAARRLRRRVRAGHPDGVAGAGRSTAWTPCACSSTTA